MKSRGIGHKCYLFLPPVKPQEEKPTFAGTVTVGHYHPPPPQQHETITIIIKTDPIIN